MPSSIRSAAPRLAILRTDSSSSIHIDREVTVVSSAADGSNARSVYSTMPLGSGHDRAQSSQGPATVSRWNSIQKMSDRPGKYSAGRTQSSLSLRDTALLESNRDSMKALSDFLMRNEPPPSNFMSRPDSDAGSLHSIKKSAFRIFGRQKSKSSAKRTKLMQLPDSAVAAKTLGGARHIAISIPLEHDYSYYDSPAPSLPPSRASSLQRTALERGAVTVLKPVVELRESGSFGNKTKSEIEMDEDKRSAKAESILGLETKRTLENYYTQLNRQQRKSAVAEGKTAVRPEPSRAQKSYVAVAPIDVARQDSTRSDPRHSGGTAYSSNSIGTHDGHSRGQSSASSVPTAASKVELPPRTSSITKISPSIQAELSRSYEATTQPATNENLARGSFMSEKSAQTAISVADSANSGTTVFSTAETAQMHIAAANIATISRSNTPKSLPLSPAPTRQLPDVPESPCIPNFLPSPTHPQSPTISIIAEALPGSKNTSPSNSTSNSPRQTRQDRVKARKQRDMALHKEKDTSPTRHPEPPQITVTQPPRTSKRRSVSVDASRMRKRTLNSLTNIMLVADLAPYTGVVHLEDLPLDAANPKRKVRDSDSNGNTSARGTHTPPSSSMESESETARKGPLDARRLERRVKRNTSLRDKEVEARLARVERDNAMLMSTLSGIASSFGELSRVLPAAAVVAPAGLSHLTDVQREIGDGGNEGWKTAEGDEQVKGRASLEALGHVKKDGE